MNIPRKLQYSDANRGFTLVELLIVMALFIIVIMISSSAFNSILTNSTQQIKSSESNIQGVIGLEIMRSDLERTGFGLPWCQTFEANWAESDLEVNYLGNGIDSNSFNDINTVSAAKTSVYVQLGDGQNCYQGPRAIQSAASSSANPWENGRDYLVIKSTSVGISSAAKKWSYLENTGGTWTIKTWGGSDDFTATNPGSGPDRLITLDAANHRLIASSTSNFSYSFTASDAPSASFIPDSPDQNYLVYGVNTAGNLRAPYNRVDYYINRPAVRSNGTNNMPDRCAKGTGILYKANLNHSGGGVAQYPLLECVADMQVVYGLDTLSNGAVTNINQDISALTAEEIRKQLKEIKVYILAHEGQKDTSYIYPGTGSVQVGEPGQGRAYDLTQLDGIGSDWNHYRWKVYSMIVKPKNINH